MITGPIKVGDILLEPNDCEIGEVTGFGPDHIGQSAVYYKITPSLEVMTTAYFVFKYFYKLGTVILPDNEST